MQEWAAGAVTRAQVVAFFEITVPEEAELDELVAIYQSTQQQRKAQWMKVLDSCLMLMDARTPGYLTHADVVARLSSASSGTNLPW